MPMSFVAFKRLAENVLQIEPEISRVVRQGRDWFVVLSDPDTKLEMGFPAIHSLMEGADDVSSFIAQARHEFAEQVVAEKIARELETNLRADQ